MLRLALKGDPSWTNSASLRKLDTDTSTANEHTPVRTKQSDLPSKGRRRRCETHGDDEQPSAKEFEILRRSDDDDADGAYVRSFDCLD